MRPKNGSMTSCDALVGLIANGFIWSFWHHCMRCGDAVARDEAVYIGAQLPPLLRGLYYEGWHPSARSTARSRAAFLERVHDGVHRDPGIDAEEVARAVFALLAARLPAAEVEAARAATPKQLHNLWPS